MDDQHPTTAATSAPPRPRLVRTRIAPWQTETLEAVYETTTLPSRAVRQALGARLGMAPRVVTVWFQNRRQRTRSLSSSVTERLLRSFAQHCRDAGESLDDIETCSSITVILGLDDVEAVRARLRFAL